MVCPAPHRPDPRRARRGHLLLGRRRQALRRFLQPTDEPEHRLPASEGRGGDSGTSRPAVLRPPPGGPPPVEPGTPGVVHAFDPYCYRCVFGYTPDICHRECITHIEQMIQYEGPETVAAVILEGVTGSTGILVPPDDHWP